jgi:ribosome-binding protein aMBF1 (putative translation factor)
MVYCVQWRIALKMPSPNREIVIAHKLKSILESAMGKKGMSFLDLAFALKSHANYAYMLVHGHLIPSRERGARIAEILEIDPADLEAVRQEELNNSLALRKKWAN